MPYLEISKQSNEIKETVKMPNVTGITFSEAKKILDEQGLETGNQMEANVIITDQLPKPGIQITKGTKVILYNE